jgi:hypothetical protein
MSISSVVTENALLTAFHIMDYWVDGYQLFSNGLAARVTFPTSVRNMTHFTLDGPRLNGPRNTTVGLFVQTAVRCIKLR